MRRERMDGAIRHIYLLRSFPSVLPPLQFGIGRHSGENRRRRFFRFVFLRKRIHARVFRSTRSTYRVVEPRMTHDDSVQIAASPEQQRALAHVATRERAHDEPWETRRFPPWPNPGRAISRIDIAA